MQQPLSRILMGLLTAVVGIGQSAQADEPAAGAWGTLSGQLIFNGDPPEQEELDITRDEEFCGPFALRDESLVVDPDSRGIRYVAIWLESREEVPIHPDLKEFPAEAPVLDNKNCRFEPHMLGVRTGQQLKITTSDPIAHNAAAYVRRNQPFSIVIPQNEPLVRTFARAESLPVRVECSIHSWMRAYLMICDHPYFAVTDKSGKFKLENLPAGEWTFHFWHERPGHVRSLRINGDLRELDRGKLSVRILPDQTVNLGQILCDADQFQLDD